MDASGWALLVAISAGCLVIALWMYRRMETPGRGRTILAVLRWAALTVAVLLLFDPVVPVSGVPGPGRARVLLDASLSMRAPDGAGTAWEAASAEAASLAADDVLVFGATTRAVAADSLGNVQPASPSSRLLPALQAAAESGVREVVVLTDGRIEDAAAVRRWLPGLGIEVSFRVFGDSSANRALAEIDAPRWAQAGEPAEIGYGVVASGPPGDSIRVVLVREGQPLAESVAPWPEPGRVATGTLRFTPAAGTDPDVHYEIRIADADAVSADDARSVVIRVSEQPAGIVLLALRPDWEVRFLQPVLQRALGLPVQGFLQMEGRGFVRTGAGLETARTATLEDVRAAVSGADLLVLQGLDPDSPAWAYEAARAARRLLVLPAGDITALGLPVETGRPMASEWYPSADVPPSPVAGLLAGIRVDDAPPLSALTPPDLLGPAWAPLLATRGRRGQPAPVLVAGETAGRRWAVATGEGYWRWAFRGGSAAGLYARLWSAVGGWLVREQAAVAATAIWPAAAVIGAGVAPRWLAPGLAADSLRIRMTAADGTVADTIVPVRSDTATTVVPAPGTYAWDITALRGDSTIAAAGTLTAEAYSDDYSRPRVTLEDLRSDAVALRAERAGGRPLHALPWAYVVLVGLVGTEWILRRRWGLR